MSGIKDHVLVVIHLDEDKDDPLSKDILDMA